MARRSVVSALVLLVGLPVLAGCGALFGQRYEDFTAYYNTFYNAQREFERAERTLLRTDQPVERTRFLSVFPGPVRTQAQPGRASGQQGFDGPIRRAADVLRDHPGSRWVDDALLLIGKAYFYQGNHDAAAQKFREVLSLEEGRRTDEAYLWLGRAHMEARNHGDAAAALRQGLARDGLGGRWAPAMRLALAENELRRGDLDAAVDGLRTGLEQIDDSELAGRAAFLLGQVHDARGEFDEAAEAYARALSLRPPPELAFAAELQRTLALARSRRSEEALVRLDRLRRDDRFFQQRAEVELTRARVLAGAGQSEEAHALFHRLLYYRDAALRIDRVRGPLHYHLAELYRDELADLRRAAAHFDTASTALRQSVLAAREMQTTREAILDAEHLAASFGSYARVRARVTDLDSLLHLGGLDDESFAEAIEAIADQRRREALAAERERRRIEDQQGFGQGAVAGGLPAGGDAGIPNGGAGAEGSGFLSFRNPVRVQENLIAFQSRWGDRPRVPNWRRREALTSAIAAANGNGAEEWLDDQPLAAAFDPLVDISAIPRTPEAYDAMREERAVARYELGNVLFLTLGDPDAATRWYRLIVDEDPHLPVARRARFALAEVYETGGDAERAAAILREISEGPDDDVLVRAARERLGMPVAPLAPDSAEVATDRYRAAFELWEDGRLGEAFRAMTQVDQDFPGTQTAGRARLAAGMIFAQWAAPDTLLLLARAPDAILGPSDLPAEDATDIVPDAVDSPETGVEPLVEPDPMPDQVDAGVGLEMRVAPAANSGSTSDSASAPAAVAHESGSDEDFGMPDDAIGTLTSRADHLGVSDPSSVDTAGVHAAGTADPGTAEAGAALPPEAAEGPLRSWLEELYASIEADFPGTPLAQRSARLRLAVEEQRLAVEEAEARRLALEEAEAEQALEAAQLGEGQQGEPVTHEEGPPDHRDADAPVDPDAADPPVPTASPIAGAPEPIGAPTPRAPGPQPGSNLMGEAPIRAADGGFSWAALVTPRSIEARNRLLAFHNRGYRTALLTLAVEPDESYVVLVGQFATESDALAARAALPIGTDHDRAEILALSPDLNLQKPEDLVEP